MKECPECKTCYDDEAVVCPNDLKEPRHVLPGTQLLASRYFLEKQLGKGAMGQVYLAKDKKFEARKVAVKTVRQDLLSSEDLPTLERPAKAISGVTEKGRAKRAAEEAAKAQAKTAKPAAKAEKHAAKTEKPAGKSGTAKAAGGKRGVKKDEKEGRAPARSPRKRS